MKMLLKTFLSISLIVNIQTISYSTNINIETLNFRCSEVEMCIDKPSVDTLPLEVLRKINELERRSLTEGEKNRVSRIEEKNEVSETKEKNTISESITDTLPKDIQERVIELHRKREQIRKEVNRIKEAEAAKIARKAEEKAIKKAKAERLALEIKKRREAEAAAKAKLKAEQDALTLQEHARKKAEADKLKAAQKAQAEKLKAVRKLEAERLATERTAKREARIALKWEVAQRKKAEKERKAAAIRKERAILERYEMLNSNQTSVEITEEPKTWAVVIGIDIYKNDIELSYLSFPSTHANEFANFLTINGYVDGEIPIVTNKRATKKNILNQLKQVFHNKKVGKDDMIMLYFSGHGGELSDGFGIFSYDYYKGKGLITDQEIYDIMIQSPAKHKVCFIESCKETETEVMSAIPQEKIDEFIEKRKKIDGGLMFMTSAQLNEKSYGYPDIGGVFSHYLFKGARGEADNNNDGFVTSKELYSYVRKSVIKRTNGYQRPAINEKYNKNIPLFINQP